MTPPVLDPTAAGERIERLLEASAAAGPLARERAEELVRVVVELYGAGLERLLELAHEAGALDDTLLSAFAADPLVSALLLVHGLHPDDVEDRVRRALDEVRSALGDSEVDLVELDAPRSVRLRLSLGGHGCGSTPETLSATVEEAVRSAAPELELVEVALTPQTATLIPVGALTAGLRTTRPGGEP